MLPALQRDRAGIGMFHNVVNPSWQTRNSVTRWFSLNADYRFAIRDD